MAGYIGKQAVVLSTTAADVNGNADIDGTVTADGLTVDTNTLHVDATNNRVGIGDTSPDRTLHVNSGSANEVARFESTDTEVTLELKDTTGTAKIKSRADFRFETGATPTEAMRIDSSGNVGIGTSSPSAPFVVSNSGAEGLEFIPDSSANAALVQAYNRSTSSFIPIQLRGSQLEFNTGGTQRLRIDSDGLKFNGDTAAANALDDYEEGTWTPASGVSLSFYNTQWYTKVGNLVTITFDIQFGSSSSGSTAVVTGLPFTPAANTGGGGACHYNTHATGLMAHIKPSGIDFRLENSQQSYASLSGDRLIGTAQYTVNS